MAQHHVDSVSELFELFNSAFDGAYKLSKAGLLADSDAAAVMEDALHALDRLREVKTPVQTGSIPAGVGC